MLSFICRSDKGIIKKDFQTGTSSRQESAGSILRMNPNIKRFVYISSITAVGPSRSYEHHRSEDENQYSRIVRKEQVGAEKIVQSYGTRYLYHIEAGRGIRSIRCRFLNIFKMTRFKLNIYPGYKHNYFSYIYALDVVRAIGKVILTEQTQNQTYFICNDIRILEGNSRTHF